MRLDLAFVSSGEPAGNSKNHLGRQYSSLEPEVIVLMMRWLIRYIQAVAMLMNNPDWSYSWVWLFNTVCDDHLIIMKSMVEGLVWYDS